ncbi:MAG TPA: hypothetical protein VGE07_03500 [Herpetosiphonaceae bacterium]
MRRHRLRTALIIAALLAGGLPLLDWLTRQPPAHAAACADGQAPWLRYPGASASACWPDAPAPFALAWFATPDTEDEIMAHYGAALAGPRWHVRRLAPRRWEIAFASAYDGRETEERIFLLAFQRSLWGETSVTIEQTLTRDRSGDTF